MIAASKWIVELAELSSLQRGDIDRHKAFLSARVDNLRPPYGRAPEEFLRRCVFGGTSNLAEYLEDPTGNRRTWAVHTGECDTRALERDRDQIWAEAVYRYRSAELNPDQASPGSCPGERWWFERDEQLEADAVVAQRRTEDTWCGMIETWSDGLYRTSGVHPPQTQFTLAEIADKVLGFNAVELKRHTKAIAQSLRSAGWDKVDIETRDGRKRRLWMRTGTVVLSPPRDESSTGENGVNAQVHNRFILS